ncbi:hypothetical protein EMIT0111MI5_150128 [Burkholderia sp. IT-111MI5]
MRTTVAAIPGGPGRVGDRRAHGPAARDLRPARRRQAADVADPADGRGHGRGRRRRGPQDRQRTPGAAAERVLSCGDRQVDEDRCPRQFRTPRRDVLLPADEARGMDVPVSRGQRLVHDVQLLLRSAGHPAHHAENAGPAARPRSPQPVLTDYAFTRNFHNGHSRIIARMATPFFPLSN